MHKKLFFLLLGCLMILALLSACGSGQQAAGHPSGGSETSSPEQSLEEVHPGEDPAQTEVLDPETNDDAGGEEAVPAMPQPPSMSAGQSEESIHSANGTTSQARLQNFRSQRPEIRQGRILGARRRAQR